MGFERPFYEDLNYRPFIFYVVFGVNGEELSVSRERYHVDNFPDGLDLISYNRSEHNEYMTELIGGTLGKILNEDNHALYETIQNTEQWVVIQGEVIQDADLNYMRNVIGFLQALIETGAVGVLDVQTFKLFTPEEWTNNIFTKEFNPYDHATILVSTLEDGAVWLHTRGMRKFGRPDISIEGVGEDEIEHAAQVINQMIYYGALGVFFSRPTKLHTHSGLTYVVNASYVDDLDNPDFNNSHYHILWKDCSLVE